MNSALLVPAHWLVKDSAAFSMARRSRTPNDASSPRAFWLAAVEATSAAGMARAASPAPIIIVPFWMRSKLRVMFSLAAATEASSDCIDDWMRCALRENASFIETTTPRPRSFMLFFFSNPDKFAEHLNSVELFGHNHYIALLESVANGFDRPYATDLLRRKGKGLWLPQR